MAEATINNTLETCILTGTEGENPDDCTTHEHEGNTGDGHTPTPWKFGHYFGKDRGFYINSPIKGIVDDMEIRIADLKYEYGDRPIAEANAAFIVRAVNSHDALVDAVRSVLDLYSYHKQGSVGSVFVGALPEGERERLRSALHLAEGE